MEKYFGTKLLIFQLNPAGGAQMFKEPEKDKFKSV